jgi:hypothetical protein
MAHSEKGFQSLNYQLSAMNYELFQAPTRALLAILYNNTGGFETLANGVGRIKLLLCPEFLP